MLFWTINVFLHVFLSLYCLLYKECYVCVTSSYYSNLLPWSLTFLKLNDEACKTGLPRCWRYTSVWWTYHVASVVGIIIIIIIIATHLISPRLSLVVPSFCFAPPHSSNQKKIFTCVIWHIFYVIMNFNLIHYLRKVQYIFMW